MGFLLYTTFVLFLIVCLFLIMLVLIQKGRGGELASAFGGGGGNTAFGSKTGDVLTWATSIVFGIFLVLAITLNLLANHTHNVRIGRGTAPPVMTTPTTPLADPPTTLPATVPSTPP